MSDDDIVVHVVNQMYELDWFSEENMMTWEETRTKKKHGQNAKHSLRQHTPPGNAKMKQKGKQIKA